MITPATKAPNITPANAREFQRRAIESRMARVEREKEEERQRDIEARAIALAMLPEPEQRRVDRLKKQIDCLLDDMEKAKSYEARAKIAGTIADIWKLVQQTPGPAKGRAARPGSFAFAPLRPATPQDPAGTPGQSGPVLPV